MCSRDQNQHYCMSRYTSHEKNTPLLMIGSPPTPETTMLPILTAKSPTKRHHSSNTASSQEIKPPHPSRHVNATTTFMPGQLSPTRLVNHEEKQLLQGITQETTKDMLRLLQSPSYLHKKRPEMEAKKLLSSEVISRIILDTAWRPWDFRWS